MASRRVAATIGSMTTGAISLEQFVNLRRRRMSCQLKCTNGGPGPGQQNNKHQEESAAGKNDLQKPIHLRGCRFLFLLARFSRIVNLSEETSSQAAAAVDETSVLMPQKSTWPATVSFVTFTVKLVFMLTSLFVKLTINSVSVLVSSGSPFSLKRAK